MKFPYDKRRHDPPAPFLPVRIAHPIHSEHSLDLQVKVDTGADLMALPESAVDALNLRQAGPLWVAGFDDKPTQVMLYAVRIELPTGRHGNLNALTIPSDYLLLGRDALNNLRILLDGPALALEILPPG